MRAASGRESVNSKQAFAAAGRSHRSTRCPTVYTFFCDRVGSCRSVLPNPGFLLLTLAILVFCGCGGPEPTAAYEVAARGLHAAALSPRSELALIGALEHGGSLWRVDAHARLFDWNHREGEYTSLMAVAFSADGTRAVTADPRTLAIWDTGSGRSLGFWTTPSAATSVAIANDGIVLMGLADHSAVLFDGGSGRHLQTLLHEGPVTGVRLSADARWALTGSEDGTAVLWDTASGAALHRLRRDGPVRVVALSDGGRYVFAAGPGDQAGVWHGADGALAFGLGNGRPITSARFSSDETRLLVGYLDRRVELWDLARRQRVAHWQVTARNPWHPTGAAVLAVGFSAQPGRFYALAGDGRLFALTRD